MRKSVKLNNVIFPIWMLWIFPLTAIIALVGNFVIDSLVILIAFVVFKVKNSTGLSIGQLYKKSILKVWIFGFLADIVGTVVLFVCYLVSSSNNELIGAMSWNPFTHLGAFLLVCFGILVAIILIFIFNYYIVFNKLIEDKKIKFKMALTIAIITMPWTYLLPTQWFYYGL